MMVAEGTPFASTVVGEVVIPVIGIIVAAILIGVYVGSWKLLVLVREIKKEVLPNGGSSLRDSVNRIEAAQLTADAKLDKHLKRAKKKEKEWEARLQQQWPFAAASA